MTRQVCPLSTLFLLCESLAGIVLVGCNSDDLSSSYAEDSKNNGCAAPYQEQDPPFLGGLMHECSGARKARVDVKICTGLTCPGKSDLWVPVDEYVPPGQVEPLIAAEELDILQSFAPLDGHPPPTGACCDPNSQFLIMESVLTTAKHDCAARSCREIHDQLAAMADALREDWQAMPAGTPAEQFAKKAFGRAVSSMDFFTAQLEMPSGFGNCESKLFDKGKYEFINPSDAGAGALRDMIISEWECLDLSCKLAEEADPTTGGGGGGSCMDNPNWYEGNAGPATKGHAVPKGNVTLEFKTAQIQPYYRGISLAYERLSECLPDSVCPFALTDLQFALDDITLGPVTLHMPEVSLARPAFGAMTRESITLDPGAVSLKIESSLLLFGQPFLDGAKLPLYVGNRGRLEMTLAGGVLEFQNASFELFDGAVARLAIAAACDEQ